jgi:RHS repeat-associated protein
VAVLGRYTEGTYLGYRGLRFRPLAPLLPGATYQVTVSGVENLYGVPMAAAHHWSFTVDATPGVFNEPTPVVKRYYFFPSTGSGRGGGQRVALRETGLDGQDVVYYLMGDHLSTTSVVLDADGSLHSEARHYPYGEERWRSPIDGTLPTDYRFTGQRDTGYIKLYQMGARWYDSELGRWISPDTIIPDPANPQSFDRYSYVNNRPLALVDSSGHAGTPAKLIRGAGRDPRLLVDIRVPASNPRTTQTARQVTSLAVDFTPGLGDAKGFAEVFTGKDLITGESLGAWRFLGLVGLSELRHLRYADEVLEFGVPIGRVLRGGKWIELGSWVSRKVSMSDAARAYQQFVTGAEAGFEFLRNGVHFDGLRLTDAGEAILLDAKSGADFYWKATHTSFIRSQVLKDARRQLAAADGLKIQWHIQDYATWEALRDLFQKEGIDIDVIWTEGP